MTSQVVFNIDSKIKAKAMKRAKAEGVPFASFLKMATEKFAEGEFGIALVRREIPNAKTARALRKASADFKKGINTSPAFAKMDDAIAWLDSE